MAPSAIAADIFFLIAGKKFQFHGGGVGNYGRNQRRAWDLLIGAPTLPAFIERAFYGRTFCLFLQLPYGVLWLGTWISSRIFLTWELI